MPSCPQQARAAVSESTAVRISVYIGQLLTTMHPAFAAAVTLRERSFPRGLAAETMPGDVSNQWPLLCVQAQPQFSGPEPSVRTEWNIFTIKLL
jgi:hypothetical protein